jgi:hypothetical protein
MLLLYPPVAGSVESPQLSLMAASHPHCGPIVTARQEFRIVLPPPPTLHFLQPDLA